MADAKSNTLETGLLKLIFQNVALANIGDASGLQPSSTAGSVYIALYEDNPTDADSGTESTYTSYARVAVARSVAQWLVSGNDVSNINTVTFPTSTGGSSTVTHFAVHTASSGGDMLYYGALNSSLAIANTDTPKFNATEISIKEK